MTTRLTTADSECGAGDVIASVRDAWGVHGRSRMVERGAERGARKFLVRSQVAPILSHDTGVHRWTSLSHEATFDTWIPHRRRSGGGRDEIPHSL